jgi:hypothetical protein
MIEKYGAGCVAVMFVLFVIFLVATLVIRP